MTLTATALGLVAIFAQIGAPLQASAGGAWRADAPAPSAVVDAGVGSTGEEASSRRLRPRDEAWIDSMVTALPLRAKVGQLVLAWLEGGRPTPGSARWERAQKLVREEGIGGFIVGEGPSFATAAWLNELQRASRVPLLVAADLEWGPGTRLEGETVIPMNMALAAAGPASYAREAGRITALEAREAGVHMAFAPVADVNVNPDNPVINTRSFGSDPREVAERVAAFIQGARSGGLLTVAKHFPGHGDTETDSHLALPVLHADRSRLESVELAPFRAAIAAGVDGVMTAHMAVPALDPRRRPRPATLSPPIVSGLLRGELGFDGLVVTDALHMNAIKQQGSPGEVAVAALKAGADVLLMPPDEKAAIDAVVRAVRRGQLQESRIDASLRRVLAAKAAAGLTRERTTNLGALLLKVGRSEHEAWSRRVAERSMTLVRGEPGALPLSVRDKAVLLVVYDDRVSEDAGEELERALAERGGRVLTLRLSESSGSAELDRVRRLAGRADLVLVASFARAVPWKGALGLPGDVAALADELTAAGAPLVSFGDPYLLRQIPGARTYLLAWDREAVSQRAAVRALVGETPITGRLPIDLPGGGYKVGDGLMVPSLPGITTARERGQ